MSGITIRLELSPEIEALLGRFVAASERLLAALDELDRLVDRGAVVAVTPADEVERSPKVADASDDGDDQEVPPAAIAEQPVAVVQKKWTAPRVIARAAVPARPAMAAAPITNWSEERTEYLKRAWSRGDDPKAIAIALNRFFGPPVSDKQVSIRAAALNLARGEVA